jgi:hypothetical protein
MGMNIELFAVMILSPALAPARFAAGPDAPPVQRHEALADR